MADYRSMFDRDFIGAWDLPRDVTVTIARVEAGKLRSGGGQTQKKPIVHFAGKEKGFALNKTNAKTIAAMYGNDTAAWIGKRITLFATKTTFGNETVDAIRVRPRPPTGNKPDDAIDPNRPVDTAMREQQTQAAEAAAKADAEQGPPPYEREPGEEG